jgi:HK97 gp10 family phage protein
MGVRVELDWGGIEALRNAVIHKADEIADEIAADASMRAPRDTGTLSVSITKKRVAVTRWHITAAPRHPRDGRAYAIYPEFGTRRMRAQPYLRPAAYTRRG